MLYGLDLKSYFVFLLLNAQIVVIELNYSPIPLITHLLDDDADGSGII